MFVLPEPLQKGDTVRIISPSDALSVISDGRIALANAAFSAVGLHVTFGENTKKNEVLTNQQKIDDIHDAFTDQSVKAIFSVIGGLNANTLLPLIDYDLISQNAKIWCGYSDIDVLSLAIFTKTGLVTYSGPHYSTFSQELGLEYTKEYFQKALYSTAEYILHPAAEWSDDEWYIDQTDRHFMINDGPAVLQRGRAEGKLLAGTLNAFLLLKGSEYMPDIANSIIAIEMDGRYGDDTLQEFNRELESILQLPNANQIKGILIGRFPKKLDVDLLELKKTLQNKAILSNKPIIANLDFGHTDPQMTLPNGRSISMEVGTEASVLKIV